MKEGYEKYCRFYRCEEDECWYNGCQCEGERLIISEEDQIPMLSYSEAVRRLEMIKDLNLVGEVK